MMRERWRGWIDDDDDTNCGRQVGGWRMLMPGGIRLASALTPANDVMHDITPRYYSHILPYTTIFKTRCSYVLASS